MSNICKKTETKLIIRLPVQLSVKALYPIITLRSSPKADAKTVAEIYPVTGVREALENSVTEQIPGRVKT
jgi:hypothetical protein